MSLELAELGVNSAVNAASTNRTNGDRMRQVYLFPEGAQQRKDARDPEPRPVALDEHQQATHQQYDDRPQAAKPVHSHAGEDICTGDRARTCDDALPKRALYQLSYTRR